ncbi:hypothetical protein GGX14DRAFT_568885 [Mycena pura]|uniref:Uncharacterized protein n=1 Tax=Mycena pura TaxID=153505 RepID=A0AAD6V885_9AGAR|nr:hypothetical protein GGX14DRAFT_568885 [Mycena pura]
MSGSARDAGVFAGTASPRALPPAAWPALPATCTRPAWSAPNPLRQLPILRGSLIGRPRIRAANVPHPLPRRTHARPTVAHQGIARRQLPDAPACRTASPICCPPPA